MQNQSDMDDREASAPPPGSAPDEGKPAGNKEASRDEQLAEAEAGLAEMRDAFVRARAEIENLRRRTQEELANAHKYAIEKFAETLLPVKDSLEMALKVDTPSVESLREGVDMTLKQLASAFEKNRVSEVNPQPGERFDPERHQAISVVPSSQAPNTVVTVMQKGYLIADRLLRPALVTVAQATQGTSGGNSSQAGPA